MKDFENYLLKLFRAVSDEFLNKLNEVINGI